MNTKSIIPAVALLLAALVCPPALIAQTDSSENAAAETAAASAPSGQAQLQQTVRRLLTIRMALEDRRVRVRDLLNKLNTADEVESERIREEIAAHREIIEQLTASFENTAVGGANLRGSSDDEERQLNWNEELAQIARPLLDSLKEATEKPRRIAELRSAIDRYQQQLEISQKALAEIARFDQQEMPEAVADGLRALDDAWQKRNFDIQNSLKIAREELNSIEVSESEVLEILGRVLREFLLGSGLTLLIALITGFAVWLIMRGLRRLTRMWRREVEKTHHAAKVRLLLYAYHLLTLVLIALAVLTVFYVRGDLLLLSLGIISLAVMALGVWRFLPGYIREARLLLDVGAARERERVIYNGLPFRIDDLNLFSELRNPELEGRIRLPLSELAQLTSRPARDEPWFPSRSGDYVLLPDGRFGQVLKQTVELVQLKVLGSIVQFAAADYLHLNVQNLSSEGFGVFVVFGIDYQHQEISLDRVPERLRDAINDALERAGFGEDLRDLLVEFKSAGTNSLDYLIYASLEGRCAASYFKLQRLLQQTCVDVCNREGWVIPFTQVTLHQADESTPQDTRISDSQQA